MARVGRHHVSDVLTDTQSSFGRSSSNIIVYWLNQPSDGHDSIAFVWLRHVSHSCSPNLKRTGDTPDLLWFLRLDVIVKDFPRVGCAARQVTPAFNHRRLGPCSHPG